MREIVREIERARMGECGRERRGRGVGPGLSARGDTPVVPIARPEGGGSR